MKTLAINNINDNKVSDIRKAAARLRTGWTSCEWKIILQLFSLEVQPWIMGYLMPWLPLGDLATFFVTDLEGCLFLSLKRGGKSSWLQQQWPSDIALHHRQFTWHYVAHATPSSVTTDWLGTRWHDFMALSIPVQKEQNWKVQQIVYASCFSFWLLDVDTKHGCGEENRGYW